MKQKSKKQPSYRAKLDKMARSACCRLNTIGDIERLAGVTSDCDRHRLWSQFNYLLDGPTQVLIDAVMDHCAAIAVRRIKAGEIFLISTYRR